ncbi:hypothetical protein N5I87_22290 [Ralstonia sp. CHL-2022]|uniref:Uncharacterized protein n=1 Tax=Ralstonia mojiangensis TaxID=2953895 RepID=A0AAE3I7F0_9RALS|nr:hypothetical protein [Ralstonia mojiangensis]MCT7318760.1 hypothetical protein [Ralstonia mojiangensis]
MARSTIATICFSRIQSKSPCTMMFQVRRTVSCLLATLAALLIMGWQPSSTSKSSSKIVMPQSIEIEIGESPQALIGRYGKAVDVDNKNEQAYGVTFYAVDWPDSSQGTVVIKNQKSEVRLDTALGVSGSFDKAHAEEGIYDYSISLGIPPRNNVTHDQARLQFYEMLKRIQQAGWKRWIYPENPRLAGAEAFRYRLVKDQGVDSLDPEYVPGLEDWMKLPDMTSWRFYLNGVYMDVQMSRDSTRMKVDEPGAYFVKIKLEGYANFWRNALNEQDRPHWRDLFPGLQRQMHAERANAEQKLKAQGYTIDTSYRNPDETSGDQPISPPGKTGAK